MLVVYTALAVLQSFATRLQWGPDEPGHIIYVRSLALDLRLPALTHGEEDNAYLPGAARTHEAHQPPLYYALAALVWRAFAGLPDQTVTFTDDQGGRQSFTVPGAVRPVRLLSVVFGAAALTLTWLTARVAYPSRPELWVAGAALAGFTPMFTYITGVVNNDSLLLLVFTAAAWQWARVLRWGAGRREAIILGLLIGLALHVKETGVAIALVSAAVLAAAPGDARWRARAGQVGLALGLGGALSAWWFVRKWLVWGSPLVYPYIYPLLGLPEKQGAALLSTLPRLVFLFAVAPADVIAARGNLALVERACQGLAALSLVGLTLAFVRSRRGGMPRWEAWSLAVWLLAALVVLAGLVRNVLTVDWRMGTSGGRYLVCVLPLLALTGARGLRALLPRPLASRLVLAAACLLLLALNIHCIWATAAGYGTLGR